MAPVLAVGVVMGGLVMPATAADSGTDSTTQSTQTAAPTTTDQGATVTAASDPTPSADPAPATSPSATHSDTAAPTDAATPTDTSSPATTAPAAPKVKAQSLATTQDFTTLAATCSPSQTVACLKVVNNVVNTGGGTAAASDWTLSAQGKANSNGTGANVGSAVSYNSGDSIAVPQTVTSGTGPRSYVVTASNGPGGYTQTSTCTSSESATNLKISDNQTVTCTFSNTFVPPVTITVQAGGIRTGTSAVTGLNSGVYQAVAVSGSPAGGPFECSMANATCAISVPSGYQWNVSAKTASTNYYLNPNLDSGSSSVGTSAPYVFKTGTVTSSITVPGANLTGVYTDANSQKFSGYFAQSLNNPAVPQQCGLKIALVLDQSGSMASDNKQTNLKTAANQVITALTGTPSSIGIYTFAAAAPYNGQTQAVTSTATTSSANTLHNFVNGLDGPSGATNWDAGLKQVSSGYDLVILLTDGNPTTFGDGSIDGSNSEFAYVEQGAFSANAIKAKGERLVGVGIGINGGGDNLRAVTGPTANSDYYLASSSSFGDTLKQLATGSCNNTLQIQKQIQSPAGVVIPDSADSNGWNFANTISSGTIGGTATTAPVSGNNGFASVPVSITSGQTPTITVTETQKPGYTLVSAQCKVNGADVATTVSGTTASFTGDSNVPITCLFTNKQPQPVGSFSVTKQVTGDSGLVPGTTSFSVDYFYNGSGTKAGTLTLTPGQTKTVSDVNAGTVVTFSEETPPTIPNGTWGAPVFNPTSVTVGADTTVGTTLTNPIAIDKGKLSVKKVVTGTGSALVGSSTSFTVNYSYPAGTGFAADNGTLTVKNDGVVVTSDDLPVGAHVTFSEGTLPVITGGTWGTPTFAPTSVDIKKDTTAAVILTNPISLDTAGFSLLKTVSGTGTGLVPNGTQFKVDWSYPAGTGYTGDSGTVTVTKGDPTPSVVNGIPVGAHVTLSEQTPAAIDGGTWGTPTFAPTSPITIGAGGTVVAVTVNNPITLNTGSFSVTKKVTGSAAGKVPTTATFNVHYAYPAGTGYSAGSGDLTVKNDGVAVSPTATIPVGAQVTLTETAPATIPGTTWGTPTFDPTSPITIGGKDTNVKVTLTNPIELNTGSLSVTKHVTGSGAYLVSPDATFNVHYQYPAGATWDSGVGAFTVTNGATTTIDNLPTGAVVTFTEDAPAAVPGGTWGAYTFDPTSVTIGKGTTSTVNLDNPITEIQPTLQLKKVVAGADVANTNWVLTGTGTGSATVTNPAGGDTAVTTVKTGVDYSLSEAAKTGFSGAGEFTPSDWVCTSDVTQGGSGKATLKGLKAGQAVVCTITNTHVNQGVTVTKTVTGSAENADGTWTTTYDVKVVNKSAVAATTYGLTDTLHFGGGITVNSASWTGKTSGSWALPNTTATLATGASVAAGATDTFSVTANATVTKAAWDAGTTDCPAPGQGGNGGFLNTATASVDGKDLPPASACAEPGTLTVKKSNVGSPVWDAASGHWTVTYDVVVTNVDPQAQYYDLSDSPAFANGVTIVSATAAKNGTSFPWTPGTNLATAAQIGGGSADHPVTDTYTVTVTADVSGLNNQSTLTCDGSGTGFYNSATLTTGTIPSSDDACANIPTTTINHTKTVVPGSVQQAVDGTWSIQYTIAVKNTGTNGGVYSLDDTLEYGAGITAGAASWTGPTSGSWTGLPGDPHVTLATARALASGATETYTVSVSGISVGAGVIGTPAATCPTTPTGKGGFNNDSGLKVNGVTTDAADCASPSKPTIAKHFVSATQSDQDPTQWIVSYTLTVDNSAGANGNFYTLNDAPGFADGVTIDGQTVTKDGNPIAWDDINDPIVEGATIAAGAKDVYTVAFTVTVDDVAPSAEKCSTEGAGNGFFNSATLSVGNDDPTSSDCGDITPKVNPDVAKHVTSTTQKADGSWDITYDVTVTQPATGATNPAGLSSKYDLSDTLEFGADIDVNSASWVKNGGGSHNWSVAFDAAETLATGAVIKQGVTDTYTVTVNADVTQKAVNEGSTVCKTGGDRPEAGGFLNTALMTVGSNETDVNDCSQPSIPTVQKSLASAPVYNAADGTWTLAYTLTATNPGADAAQFTLTDDPSALPSGVATVGKWQAAAADDETPAPETSSWAQGDTATIAHGSLGAGKTYTYDVTVTVKVSAASEPQQCGDETGIVVTNGGEITSGKIVSDDTACGAVQFYDLGIVKTHTSPTAGGAVDSGKNDPIDYKLVATNHGTTAVTGATVDDPMPAGLTLDTSSIVAESGWDTSASTATEFKATYAGQYAAGASSTFTFTAIVGELSRPDIDQPFPNIDNTACVTSEGPDQDPTNDCSTDTTKVKSIAVDADAICRADAPVMSYSVTPYNVADGQKIALIWWTKDAYANRDPNIPATDEAAILANGASQVDYIGTTDGGTISGSHLWPGAAQDANGKTIAWPGWRQLASGQWVLDPAAPFYNLRSEAVVEIRINPSTGSTEVYPPSSPNCNPYPPKTTPGGNMADTGSDLLAPLGGAALLLALGAGLMFWISRRRRGMTE